MASAALDGELADPLVERSLTVHRAPETAGLQGGIGDHVVQATYALDRADLAVTASTGMLSVPGH